MPRYFLTRIRVEGFRGINNEGNPLELRFRPDAVNSVFAVNGAGKSSLFEALSYAIHGKVPKLEALQTAERPEKYYNNRFHSQNKAVIDLEFLADDGRKSTVAIRVERNRAGNRRVTSPSGEPEPEAFLRALREDFALLDYGTFVRFIDDTPLNRGRSFAALLGLSAYSRMRQALQSASDTRSLNTDLNIGSLKAALSAANEMSQRALATVRASYEHVTGKALEDVARLDEYKSEVVRALGSIGLVKDHFVGRELDEVDFDTVKETVRTAEGGEKRREFESAVEATMKLEALGDVDLAAAEKEESALSTLLEERDSLMAATRGDLFRRFYDSAQAVFDGGEWDEDRQCPLCESGLDSSIREHVAGQLGQYRQVAAKSNDIRDTWHSATWVRRLHQLEKSEQLEVPEEERLGVVLTHRADAGDLTKEEVISAVDLLRRLEAKRDECLEALRKRKGVLEAELPRSLVQLTEQIEHGRQFQESLSHHAEKAEEERRLNSKLRVRRRWCEFIGRATSAFAGAEAELSRTRIAAIHAEYKTMFKRIMNVGDVIPELQRADLGEELNVELRDFHGQRSLSARALLSESYRNALAISVFLGAAMKHSGRPRFVVLDDVTSSFDAGHQFHFMELIRQSLQHPTNADGLQFVLLSHDGFLEKYFDRLGNTAEWHHQRLQGWPPMGTVMSHAQDADRLRVSAESLLNAGQVREADPLIRQYLEFRLLQVIQKVGIPVPFDFAVKERNRMVSNCLDAVQSAVNLHRQAGTLILDEQQVADLTTVHVPALVGNWVSHYETASGSSLSPPMLMGVLQTIDDFAECFRVDDTSGSTTSRKWYRSLSART